MAPRNQTKKILSLEERAMLADIKEAAKAIKKQKKEDKHQAVIDNRIARRQAKLDKLINPEPVDEAKPEPVDEAKPEPVDEAKPEPVPNPDVIVIDD
jgi:hypothetical protein